MAPQSCYFIILPTAATPNILAMQLIAQHLNKSYHTRLIVQDISLDVRQGEIIGLLGPNGTGKTTAFYMLAGLIQPDSGRIWLDQADITAQPLHARAKLGISYLPQEASIFRKLSVKDNILAALELTATVHGAQKQQMLMYLLETFRLTTVCNTIGMYLSGGERRRAEIARLLALQPKFILLDEPFAGIDPLAIIELKHLIQTLAKQGIGILITDHNVRETLAICQRAYILHQGTLLYAGSPQMISNNPQVKLLYLGAEFNL